MRIFKKLLNAIERLLNDIEKLYIPLLKNLVYVQDKIQENKSIFCGQVFVSDNKEVI